MVRSDRDGEYMDGKFKQHLRDNLIQCQNTTAKKTQAKMVWAKHNRTLTEKARSMLAHSGLSNAYWAEAIGTASYLHNLLPNSSLGGSIMTHEKWTGRKPVVSHLCVFRCAAYAHVPAEHRRKLDINYNLNCHNIFIIVTNTILIRNNSHTCPRGRFLHAITAKIINNSP